VTSEKIRVVFLIRSLEAGGAERQLVELVRNLDHATFGISVFTFYPGGVLESDLENLPGVRLRSARKAGRWDLVGFLVRSWRLMRIAKPHIVHGYMSGANEIAWLLGRAIGARVVWGIRASNMDLRRYDWMTRFLFTCGAWLSRRADLVIANSRAGKRHHLQHGYAKANFMVIENGIDTVTYCRNIDSRERLRKQWGIGEDQPVVGLVGRFDPMKDHETFLRAAAIAAARLPSTHFVFVGTGSVRRCAELQALARELGVGEHLTWAGAHRDMAAVYRAFDVATSSSAFGEGFSNSLAEAMACETVCVASDVGDARVIVGDTGEIIPPRDADALAEGWLKVLQAGPAERAERGRQARRRVVEHFSVSTLAARTSEALLRVAAGQHPVP